MFLGIVLAEGFLDTKEKHGFLEAPVPWLPNFSSNRAWFVNTKCFVYLGLWETLSSPLSQDLGTSGCEKVFGSYLSP